MLIPINEQQKTLIVDLMIDKLTLDQFTHLYKEPVTKPYAQAHLHLAVDQKNEDELWLVLILIFRYDLANPHMLPLLEQALAGDWHTSHEDIVTLLDKLESPTSVHALAKAATSSFSYLDYDDTYALARRCLWALGSINTEEAKQTIEQLTHSDIAPVREHAEEQLARLQS